MCKAENKAPTTLEIKEMLKIIPNGFNVCMEDLIELWNLNRTPGKQKF